MSALLASPEAPFLTEQHGVMTRSQALTLMTRHQLYRLVSSARWARPARGVLVNHAGPLTLEQRDWVALLVAPMSTSPMAYDDVDLHWSVHLDSRDVHPLRTPPRTRPARSVIDAASHMEVERWDGDLLRLNEVAIGGRRTLVFSSYAIRRHRAVVLDQLRRSTS